MVKKIQYLFVLIAVFALVAGFSLHKGKGGSIRTVVIDAGHGGLDPGCKGAANNEKDVALAVALKLGKLIEENLKDVKVIYTRTTDIFVSLEDRAQIANKAKADLFISIHCNAAGKPVMVKDKKTGKKRKKMYKNKKGKMVVVETTNPIPFGTETYVMGIKNEEGKMKVAARENSVILLEEDYEKKYGGFDPDSQESYIIMSNYTSAYVIQSANLAVKIQDEYTKKAGRIDKGVHRQSIWVLWRTSMPSILTELGFLTNPLEEQFLASEKGQEYLAKSIFRGLRKYKDDIEGNKQEYNDDIEKQNPLENENLKAGNLPNQKTPNEEDEEEEEKEVKKPEEKKEIPVNTNTVEIKSEEKKEKVNDGRYVEIELKKADSLKLKATADSLQAKEIADKFKREKELKEKEQLELKEKELTAAKEKAQKELREKEAAAKEKLEREQKEKEAKEAANSLTVAVKAEKSAIVFKVLFASSDVKLNLKQEKFKDIVNGSFYKAKEIYKYTSGNFALMKDASAHQNALREKGFKDCFVIAMKNGERMDVAEAKKETGQ